MLPLSPPYTKVEFLAAGGSAEDRANDDTPASASAQVIDLTAGSGARWRSVGPMPTSRVLGDAVLLCDGTVGLFNGAGKGIGGWSKKPRNVVRPDGTSWYCEKKCSRASSPRYEPTIYDPESGEGRRSWIACAAIDTAHARTAY